MLQVRNGFIVNASNRPVQLRGTCIGGWMHMENFINGYPGAEHALRDVLKEELGAEKSQAFFDGLLDHFFTEEDVKFIRSLGLNTVRIALNYRQFESDARPFEHQEEGFLRLDQALEWCQTHEVYAILDLHAVQGWQNTDWHSDNANRMTLFWQHGHFQDRFVALWERFAARYKNNPWVAGYNLINEPVTNASRGRFRNAAYTPDWATLNQVYRRTVAAIRKIDPHHIIFLEGDLFSNLFDGLEAPFAENLVYSSHNYTPAGFGPGPYPGEFQGFEGSFQTENNRQLWDRDMQKQVFQRSEGYRFARKHNVPLWIGEFGSVYNGPGDDLQSRLRAIDDQISVFEELGVHWTTWNYKDVGVMGLVTLDPQSAYMKRIQSVLQAKFELDTDFWMGWLPQTQARQKLTELNDIIESVLKDPGVQTPANRRFLGQATFDHYVGGLMQWSFARLFADLTLQEIRELLRSCRLEHCQVNRGLAQVLERHAQSTVESTRGVLEGMAFDS